MIPAPKDTVSIAPAAIAAFFAGLNLVWRAFLGAGRSHGSADFLFAMSQQRATETFVPGPAGRARFQSLRQEVPLPKVGPVLQADWQHADTSVLRICGN